MAKWEKGQSGNPSGSQPGSRVTITDAIRKAITRDEYKLVLKGGKDFKAIPKDEMARYLAEAMMTGEVKLPNEAIMKLAPKEWWETYWNIVNRLDGPPMQAIDLTNRQVLNFDANDTIFDSKVEVDADKVE